MIRPALLLLCLLAVPATATAERLRIATYAPDLTAKGPGLLLRDIDRGKNPQIDAVVAIITKTAPDVLLLTGFDWDLQGKALAAFAQTLRQAGADYPHLLALRPNTGMPTGLDIDGNGRLGEPRDAQGYGRFTGAGGMALLSRVPIDQDAVRDFSAFLWRDLPGALIDGAALLPEASAIQRLSTTAHWDVPLIPGPGRRLNLWAFAATPPVFDGPEDRNGRRNHDETAFWLRYLDGALPQTPTPGPFVILGDVALDPARGEGRRDALHALLADPRLQDPITEDTVDYGPPLGRMRVDYVLPSADLVVLGSGVVWDLEGAAQASRHRLVWVDIDLP